MFSFRQGVVRCSSISGRASCSSKRKRGLEDSSPPQQFLPIRITVVYNHRNSKRAKNTNKTFKGFKMLY